MKVFNDVVVVVIVFVSLVVPLPLFLDVIKGEEVAVGEEESEREEARRGESR